MQGTNDAGQCGGAVLAISASASSVSSGTVVFSNSNNVSFGMSGSTITASASSPAETPFAVSASGSSQSTGTVVFSNSNNVTFGMSGSVITASVQTAGGTASGVGLAAGTQTATTGVIKFANSNGVTFGMSGSSQVTASYSQSTAPSAISASGSSASSGTIVFSNSNNITFGMNGNTITASASAQSTGPGAIAAGTQTGTSGTILFQNSNNITFGMAGSSIVTASFNATQSTAPSAIAAGSQTATSGTVVFVNSNGLTFGMSGSSQVTASYSQSTSPGAIAAGTQTATSGTIVFSNSNGITFGMSGSSQVTASFGGLTVSQFYPGSAASWSTASFDQSVLHIHPVTVPNVVFSVFAAPMSFAQASDATATVNLTISFGIYTQNVSTLSLLHSTTMAVSATITGTASSSLYNGGRLISTGWTSTITQGQYWAAMLIRSQATTSAGGGTINLVPIIGQNTIALSGVWGAASNASQQVGLGHGAYSAITQSLPAAIQFSEIEATVAQALRLPIYYLGQTV